ncbi:UNVERIFIED_CONTAM: hypothetical protein FKN15_042487 [Acipenser sinensis]
MGGGLRKERSSVYFCRGFPVQVKELDCTLLLPWFHTFRAAFGETVPFILQTVLG